MICGACGKETDCVVLIFEDDRDTPGICEQCGAKRETFRFLQQFAAAMTAAVVLGLAGVWILKAFGVNEP